MNIDAYQQQFLEFEKELKSFLFRILTNKQDCEDILQDTYLKFSENIDSFRGESLFKTWVFSIALNLAKNLLKKTSRWKEEDMDTCRDYHEKNPHMLAEVGDVFHSTPEAKLEIKEHLDYCFTCMSKTLSLTQQICLLLKDVYGFKQQEIKEITGLDEGKVKHGIVDARKTMIRIFNNRCALINKNGVCNQCTALKGVLNPDQDAHIEANKLKMVKESEGNDYERLLELRLELVRSVDPVNNPATGLHIFFLENIPKWVEMAKTDQ